MQQIYVSCCGDYLNFKILQTKLGKVVYITLIINIESEILYYWFCAFKTVKLIWHKMFCLISTLTNYTVLLLPVILSAFNLIHWTQLKVSNIFWIFDFHMVVQHHILGEVEIFVTCSDAYSLVFIDRNVISEQKEQEKKNTAVKLQKDSKHI